VKCSWVPRLAIGLVLIAAGCNNGSTPFDPLAPNPVVDLSVVSMSGSAATLGWTAPRVGSANGRATRYQILYTSAAKFPIDWSTATAVASPPQPSAPGTAEQFTVDGLTRLTTYHFAVRCDDGHGDWSLFSNTPAATIPWIPTSQGDLIDKLEEAYRHHDYAMFASIFPAPEDSVAYFFFLNDPPGANWDRIEELRIHRRMFKPEDPLPGETPVIQDLWLVSIDILLEPQTEWTERPDLYVSQTNPNGLNPARWKVTDAQYHTYVLFTLQGVTSYQVNGRANFVVIENLHKQLGVDRKFLLYRWEDLGSLAADGIAVQPTTWTGVKGLYR
jgi:hypothetical protein